MLRYGYAISTIGNRITNMFIACALLAYITAISISFTVLVAISAGIIYYFIALSYWSVVFTFVMYSSLMEAQRDLILLSGMEDDIEPNYKQ